MARIRILRGARAGATLAFETDAIRIGRDASADLRFDPQNDLDVSARHALLFRRDGAWLLRDLASTNGTWLNGKRVDGDAPVHSGDHVQLGPEGPLLEVLLGAATEGASRTQVLRAQLHRQGWRLKVISGGALVVIATLVIAQLSARQARRQDAIERERERANLQAQIDSLLGASDGVIASLRGEMDSLVRALRQSEAEIRRTRAALQQTPAGRSSAETDELGVQLRSATQALARQQLAASLDFRTIERDNRPAVALLFVEAQDGTVTTATAFAVRADATLLTVGHVLHGPDGSRTPRRVAVQFADSEQFFPARIVAIAEDADLALVRAENIEGVVPVVSGLRDANERAEIGEPVAVIGFPLGGETAPRAIGRGRARPLVTAGVITGESASELEVQGYGAAGASGSPIFDASGRVAAILIGGRAAGGRPGIVGVPAGAAARLLEKLR